jgi:hypothetical protein
VSDDPGPTPPLPSGQPDVDRALALLAEIGGRPVAEQVDRYDAAHRALRDALVLPADPGAPESAPGRGRPPTDG